MLVIVTAKSGWLGSSHASRKPRSCMSMEIRTVCVHFLHGECLTIQCNLNLSRARALCDVAMCMTKADVDGVRKGPTGASCE